jgi:HSP20 family molecular chaperone IbpA
VKRITDNNPKPTKWRLFISALIRYNNPVSSLSNWLDNFFNDSVFEAFDREVVETDFPIVDITENGDNYLIKADLPGWTKKISLLLLRMGL